MIRRRVLEGLHVNLSREFCAKPTLVFTTYLSLTFATCNPFSTTELPLRLPLLDDVVPVGAVASTAAGLAYEYFISTILGFKRIDDRCWSLKCAL